MHKILRTTTMFIGLAAMALASSHAAWAAGKKIGIAAREITNDYNRGIIDGARRVLEAAGDSVVVTDAQTDPRKLNEDIENLINSHVDGIIVQLGNAQQLAPVVAKANAAHIPVVTTSVGALTPGAVTDIDGDDALMSALMSRALLSSINYKGDVYVFSVPGAPILETRKRILEAMVKDYPQVHLHDVPTQHDPAQVQSQMEDILTANPDPGSIAAVWGAYDLLTSGAVQAIRAAGRPEIKVASIDGDRVGFQMLMEKGSPFIATVVQDVPHIGELAGQAMIDALAGKKDFPATMYTDAYVATHDNAVAAAEKRWGPDVWQKIQLDPKAVAAQWPQTGQVVVVRPTLP